MCIVCCKIPKMPLQRSCTFPPISNCDATTDRQAHTVAADLDGTLLVSRSSFPYFMVLSVEAGSVARGILLLLSSPFVLFLYKLVSESAAIKLLIFISTAGIPFSRISRVCKDILPRYYAEDVREESWRAFRQCGRRRVVVTANPTVLVESFVRKRLRGDLVIGTELEVKDGITTGWVEHPGIIVGSKKKDSVLREFGEAALPDLGLGDRESDHDFMGLCKVSWYYL